jgi:uncharacterized protein (UPF0332 family)
MKAEELMHKARQAVASAQALYALPDMDGACNRAYYAMFDAARAALMRSGAPVGAEVARTHSGLITAFGLHLVKTGRVPIELGRAINRADELRLVADYTGVPVDAEQASWAVENADLFVSAIDAKFF